MKTQSNVVKLFNFFTLELQGNIDFSHLSLTEVKEHLNSVDSDIDDDVDMQIVDMSLPHYKDVDQVVHIEILRTCLEAVNSDFNDLEFYEFVDLLVNTDFDQDDFYIENLPCGEVRLIDKNSIDEIWTESLIELVKDCYDLSDVPNFVAIDWNQTAENCKADGLGHHFASYDHEEHESGNFYIFRIN